MVIFAGTKGHLDDLPVKDVKRFESELLDYLRSRKADLLASIRESGKLPDDAEDVVKAFKQEFVPSETVIAAGED